MANDPDAYGLAVEAYQKGNMLVAEQYARQAAALPSSGPDQLLLLGVALIRLDRIEQAKEPLLKVVRLSPNRYEAVNWLSILERRLGNLNEAESWARSAVDLRPLDPEGYNNLAICLAAAGKHEESTEELKRACELSPSTPILRHRLAMSLLTIGDQEGAKEQFELTLKLDRNHIPSLVGLGQVKFGRGEIKAAAGCGKKALALAPGNVGAHLLLAQIETDAELSRWHLDNVIEQHPSNSTALRLLGVQLSRLGDVEGGRRQLFKSIEAQPIQGLAYWGLVQARRSNSEDIPFINRMASVLDEPGLAPQEKAHLHYALGKVSDELGQYQESMRHYDEANRLSYELHLADNPFDEELFERGVGNLTEIFSEELLGENKHIGLTDRLPIFVVGQIRSGTTLVEQILSSHPDVAAGGEQLFWSERGHETYDLESRRFRPEHAQTIASDYLSLLNGIGKGKPHVTDKMPLNLQILGLLHILFPNAPIICLNRQPIDNCLSIYMTPWVYPMSFAHSKKNIAAAHRQYMRYPGHWRRVLPPGRVFEVQYEELVQRSEEVIRAMLDYCGLPWDQGCLSPERNAGLVATPSLWQVRQPIYRTSVEKWRRFEPWLGELSELREE